MTTKELLAKLNALRVANGKTELANWKSSREKLDAAIEAETPSEPQTEEVVTSDLSDVEGQTEQPAAEVLIPRGAIGALSIKYLTGSDEPYAGIVAKIVAKYPTAKTTARSLASVAMDLRKDGVDVPGRRKPAKAKPAKAEKPAKAKPAKAEKPAETAPAGE